MKRTVVLASALIFYALADASRGVDVESGRSSFSAYCSPCHGTTGRGDGPAGRTLRSKPANFTDCGRMSKASDDDIFEIIKEGGGVKGLSSEMPPWNKAFSDEEIRDLVAFVRTFCRSSSPRVP